MNKRDAKLAAARDKAVVDAHPAIRGFLAERRFDDEGFIRAVLVEYIRYAAELKFVMEDDDL